MERKRLANVLMIVAGTGSILSCVGMIIVPDMGQGIPLYNVLTIAFVISSILLLISFAYRDYHLIFKTAQNQAQSEQDSSLV
jgi:hypothetical protein